MRTQWVGEDSNRDDEHRSPGSATGEDAGIAATIVSAVSAPAVVGIDVGATKIIGGLVAADGQVLARDTMQLTAATVASGLTRPLAEMVDTFRLKAVEPYEVVGVGVGTAGVVRWPEGEVGFAANHGHRGLKLRERLGEQCGLPVVVENDANVAALSEATSRRDEAIMFVAIGTGLGSGLTINGGIFRWRNGLGLELGHVVVEHDPPIKCACGRFGCLETLASGRALARLGQLEVASNPDGLLADFLRRRNLGVSMRSMIDAALAGVPTVRRMVQAMGEHVGTAIGRSAQALLPVDRIVIGGGLSVLGELLTQPIRNACRRTMGRSRFLIGPTVSSCTYGREATMIGAGLLGHLEFGSASAALCGHLR